MSDEKTPDDVEGKFPWKEVFIVGGAAFTVVFLIGYAVTGTLIWDLILRVYAAVIGLFVLAMMIGGAYASER